MTRRARRALAWGFGSLAGFHLLLVLAFEPPESAWRDPEFSAKLRSLQALLRENPTRPLLLLLGSSRTSVGLSPERVASASCRDGRGPLVFNFGFGGHGPLQELMTMHRLLRCGIVPQRVLIEIHPALLHQEPEGYGEARWMRDEQLDEIDRRLLNPFRPGPSRLAQSALGRRCERFEFLCRRVNSWIERRSSRDCAAWIDRFGWWPWPLANPAPEKRCFDTESAQREYAGAFHGFRVTPMADRAVRELIELCRDRGIATALYLMPEASNFRSWYPPGARHEIESYLAALRATYRLEVFDATAFRDDDDFADGHHLLRMAAESFSARFGREIVQPWLAGYPGTKGNGVRQRIGIDSETQPTSVRNRPSSTLSSTVGG
jgi:hypothetical protein